jgi:hypothetical protein
VYSVVSVVWTCLSRNSGLVGDITLADITHRVHQYSRTMMIVELEARIVDAGRGRESWPQLSRYLLYNSTACRAIAHQVKDNAFIVRTTILRHYLPIITHMPVINPRFLDIDVERISPFSRERMKQLSKH